VYFFGWESFLLYGDLEQKKAPEATNLGSFVPMPNWFQPSLFMAGQVRGILCEQDQAACLHVSRGQKERERRAFLVPAETVLPCLCLRVSSLEDLHTFICRFRGLLFIS
jgi:hypothetical protein